MSHRLQGPLKSAVESQTVWFVSDTILARENVRTLVLNASELSVQSEDADVVAVIGR